MDADRLRELLDYDAETGIFTRRLGGRGARKGSVVGTLGRGGYIQISVDGRDYLAHRLAWLYTYGRWPVDQIDHRDCNRANNRLANLREATQAENNRNSQKSSHNTSGFKGVSFDKRDGRWRAQIYIDGKHSLGSFITAAAAAAAYDAAALKFHGEFARTNVTR